MPVVVGEEIIEQGVDRRVIAALYTQVSEQVETVGEERGVVVVPGTPISVPCGKAPDERPHVRVGEHIFARCAYRLIVGGVAENRDEGRPPRVRLARGE